jgi:two-component system sensor histidine kinase PhoQ
MTLSRRLLLAATVILFVFLGLTGLVLDRAYTHSAEQAVHERLRGQVFIMLAAADFDEQQKRLTVDEPLPDPQLSSPQSGLYAGIYTASAFLVWKSPSALGLSLPRYTRYEIAQWNFEQLLGKQGEPYFSLSFAVAWEAAQGQQFRYIFQVLEDHALFNRQVAGFRNELWGWLLGATVMLLLAQALILSWSLKPLREVAVDLDRVKAGEADRLQENYPGEIRGLTESINTFIDSERMQRDRYRNTLADLAHSLKTPLAVLKTGIHDADISHDQSLNEQVDRMTQIVDYQLHRASASGRTSLGATVPLLHNIERLVNTLAKVHADRGILCDIHIDAGLVFPGEEGDLLEIAGNLLENAYKWSQRRISVSATIRSAAEGKQVLQLMIEDDGKGVPQARRGEVLLRGKRADESVSGHGIGLSVVQEIVNVYGGSFVIGDSKDLGGACMIVQIPVD